MPSRGLVLATAAVTFLVFSPVLGGAFLNWDDDRSLLGNDGFRGLDPAHLHWMFTTTLLGHYAPLTWLSFGVTYALAGMTPGAYHFGNLALHALNAVLVYLLAERLLSLARPTAASARSAPGRLSPPWRSPSIRCGWRASDGSPTGATCCARRSPCWRSSPTSASPGPRSRARAFASAASLAALAAALLSKEIAMTLPLSLLLLDAYPLRRWARGPRALIVEKALFVLAAVGAAVAVFARGHGAGWTSYAEHGLGTRVALAAYSLAFYPLKFVWPSGLSPLYELPVQVSPLEPRFVAGVR